MDYVFLAFRDVGINVAIWCFSFKYWNISFNMPVQLAGKKTSLSFNIISLSIFVIGCILNVTIPCTYIYFAAQANIDGDATK